MRLHRHSARTRPRHKQGHCLTPKWMERKNEEEDESKKRQERWREVA